MSKKYNLPNQFQLPSEGEWQFEHAGTPLLRGGNYSYGTSALANHDNTKSFIVPNAASHKEKELSSTPGTFRAYDEKNRIMLYSNKTTDGPDCFYFWELEPTLKCTAHRFTDSGYEKDPINPIMQMISRDSKGNPLFEYDILEFDDISFSGLIIRNTCVISINRNNLCLTLSDFKIPTGMKASEILERQDSRDVASIVYDCLVVGNKYEGFLPQNK